jgi:opacity protein-like surface antigen
VANSSDDDWLDGYYLGGGVEALLTDNVSFKMEYRFSDLGTIKTSKYYEVDAEPHGYAAAGVEAEANPTVHAIRATVNWRF